MKHIFFAGIIYVGMMSCQGDNVFPKYVPFDGMNGKIEMITEKDYTTRDRFGVYEKEDLVAENKKIYDKYGHVLVDEYYDGSGELVAAVTKYYDGKEFLGELPPDKHNVLDGEVMIIERGKDFARFENGYTVKWKGLTQWSYNENGIKVSEFLFNKDFYTIEWKAFDEEGKITYRETNEYDDNNMLIRKVQYRTDGKLSVKYEYKEFDDMKNWTLRYAIDEDSGEVILSEREYCYKK